VGDGNIGPNGGQTIGKILDLTLALPSCRAEFTIHLGIRQAYKKRRKPPWRKWRLLRQKSPKNSIKQHHPKSEHESTRFQIVLVSC
jgi:hypothetical protein